MAAAADNLAGYRNSPKKDGPQEPVEDRGGAPPSISHEGEDAAARAAAAPVVATPLVTGDRTPNFVDRQRQAIAERFKRERVEERANQIPASHVPFIDGNDQRIPGALPVDESEPADADAASEARERAESDMAASALAQGAGEPAQQPTHPEQQRPYTLVVDRNQFQVNRDELLRYAEVDQRDADQFSDLSLIRLAQKQIALSNRLAEANAFKDRARAEAQQPPQAPPPPRPAMDMDAALIQAVETIQGGDPREGARELRAVFDAGVQQAIQQDNQTRALWDVQREYAGALGEFQNSHPEIVANQRLARAHITFVAGEIADDLRGLGLVTEDQHAAIATNPRLAADVLTAALIERRPIRSPSQIFKAASDQVVAMLPPGMAEQNIAQTRPSFVPSPAINQRLAEKRALMPQPARSGISHIGNALEAAPEEDRISRTSRIIQETRKARFQPTS